MPLVFWVAVFWTMLGALAGVGFFAVRAEPKSRKEIVRLALDVLSYLSIAMLLYFAFGGGWS